MDARATRRGVPAVILWGAVGALAWATLTVLLGGGTAQAEEEHDGPLDGLTSLVSDTVSVVTAPVKPIVTEVVAPVVTQVVAPVQKAAPAVVETVTQTVAETPVVGPVTTPVVHAVTDTATAVVTPVADVLTGAPVSQITEPILDTVAGLPLVGGLVTDLGVISAVDDVVGVVDDTTALLGNVTNETVPPVLEALDPTSPAPAPGAGAVIDVPAAVPPVDVAVVPAAPPSAASLSAPGPVRSAALLHDAVAIAGDDTTRAPADTPSGSPPGAPAPASSSAGSGGSGGAAHARLSDAGTPPLRACERTSGASDDVLPSSPVADTDVSPD